jgi:diaminohydroxyphosphoribosylaminopyrimidine deaminase/5-amino-6-(5-phosphoribosylamino)uracil reductase
MRVFLRGDSMSNALDKKYMKLALELAQLGKGKVSPNPMVGAVIVRDGEVLGKGYHQAFGEAHAEVNAILESKNSGHQLEGATIYVTLEPCSHHGKTPPCADALIHEKFARVVIAMEDPNPLVSGRGIKKLQEHGIEVDLGLMGAEARKLNEIFITYISKNKPFVVMKSAMSLDGKIATATGDSKWISSEASRQYVHQLRADLSAIMVGIGTDLSDDPQLTTRLLMGNGVAKDPHRIIVDTHLRIPLTARVLHLESLAKTIIVCGESYDLEKRKNIESLGAQVIPIATKDGRVDLNALMTGLMALQIDSILLEGGSSLNFSALKSGIVDKIMFFVAPLVIGGELSKGPVGGEGISLLTDAFSLLELSVQSIGKDLLIEAYLQEKGV